MITGIKDFFKDKYEELGDKYSDFNDLFGKMSHEIESIPDKLTPLVSGISGEKGKGLFHWLMK